eukprot:scaffold1401_cov330-Pavlova_lutheri.AAC.137
MHVHSLWRRGESEPGLYMYPASVKPIVGDVRSLYPVELEGDVLQDHDGLVFRVGTQPSNVEFLVGTRTSRSKAGGGHAPRLVMWRRGRGPRMGSLGGIVPKGRRVLHGTWTRRSHHLLDRRPSGRIPRGTHAVPFVCLVERGRLVEEPHPNLFDRAGSENGQMGRAPVGGLGSIRAGPGCHPVSIGGHLVGQEGDPRRGVRSVLCHPGVSIPKVGPWTRDLEAPLEEPAKGVFPTIVMETERWQLDVNPHADSSDGFAHVWSRFDGWIGGRKDGQPFEEMVDRREGTTDSNEAHNVEEMTGCNLTAGSFVWLKPDRRVDLPKIGSEEAKGET